MKDDKKKLKCGYCKKKGHSKDECRRKKADEDSANVAQISSVHNAPLRLFIAHTHSHIPSTHWIIDSGASSQPITVGNGNTLLAAAVGQIVLDTDLGNKREGRVILHDVYYVPDLTSNLLSIVRLARQGIRTTFNQNKCRLTAGQETYSLPSTHMQYSSMARQPDHKGTPHIETDPSTSYLDDRHMLNWPFGLKTRHPA